MVDTLRNSIQVLEVGIDYEVPSITITSNWWVIAVLLLLLLILRIWLWRHIKRIWTSAFVEGQSIKFKTGILEIDTKVKRSWGNLYIANRIYIELITRKAAIPFDEDHDLIPEIYNSWYALFTEIRNEIKNLPGEFMRKHESSRQLIDLTTRILNEGLRPHLTEYQARFRKWYKENAKKDSYMNMDPQDIQKDYPRYSELVNSMKEVNQTLYEYSVQLKKLIDGD